MSINKIGLFLGPNVMAVYSILIITSLSACSENNKNETIVQKKSQAISEKIHLDIPNTIFPDVIDLPRLSETSGDYGCGLPSLINNAYVINDTPFANTNGYTAFACEILNSNVRKIEKLNTVIKYSLSLEGLGWIPMKSNSTTSIEYYNEGLFDCRNKITISTKLSHQLISQHFNTLSKQSNEVQSRALFFKLTSECDEMNNALKSAHNKYRTK